ncbi:MAG: PIG-L family deacetylase [Chloroflexi bacterium]|nr:MAG: PIG-L family deacetylase [Chloroflexota bacterium]
MTERPALFPGTPASALAIFAHPDDPEFVCGGLIANWTDAGARVGYVIMTDGRAGGAGLGDELITPEELVLRREDEQRRAAAHLGVAPEDIVFFREHDGELFHTLELRRRIVREIRRFKPEAAILFDPRRRVMPGYVQHPDHWTSGEAALAAIAPLAGNRLAFPELLAEGLEPHQIRDIYLASPVDPNLRIDIEPQLERKVAAMNEHTSQVADPERTAGFMRDFARMAAAGSRYEFAEAYHFIRFGERFLTLED